MLESWWLAHKLEFVISGVIIGLFIAGGVVWWLTSFIMRAIRYWQR